MGNLLCCCCSLITGFSQKSGNKSKCLRTEILNAENMKELPGVTPGQEEKTWPQLMPSTDLDLVQKVENSQNSNVAPALPGSGFVTALVRIEMLSEADVTQWCYKRDWIE